MYLGDFATGATVRKTFNTRDINNEPITLAGIGSPPSGPTVRVYKDGNTTEVSSGVTLTVDYDGRTGLHMLVVDLSSAPSTYAAGAEFKAVLTEGSVDGLDVSGTVLAEWSIENRFAEAGGSGSPAPPTAEEILAAIVAYLEDETHAMIGQEAFTEEASLAYMLRALYKLGIVETTQSATLKRVKNYAGTQTDHKADVSETTSLTTHGRLVAGP
jgi:hypothetical protein